MENYKVQYSFLHKDGITLVVIYDHKEIIEISNLSSRIYRSYYKENEDLKIYFFKTISSALRFIYLKFISDKQESISLPDVHCSAFLDNKNLSFPYNEGYQRFLKPDRCVFKLDLGFRN
ncbi:MAG: hypothetical protein ABI462_10965 [Ignavibacteria bacterium]